MGPFDSKNNKILDISLFVLLLSPHTAAAAAGGGGKLAFALFKKTIQHFAIFPKLIREMLLFWNSIFSKSS